MRLKRLRRVGACVANWLWGEYPCIVYVPLLSAVFAPEYVVAIARWGMSNPILTLLIICAALLSLLMATLSYGGQRWTY